MNLNYEPVVVAAVIESAIVLLMSFGIPISTEQKAAIIALTSVLLVLVGSLFVRARVTPVAKPANMTNPELRQ